MDTKLLDAVERWGLKCGFDDFDIATAQSLAWYYKTRFEGELADSHWARMAIRAVRNGRDLPGCGTRARDALHRTWLGAGMGEVMDKTPAPDVLVASAELYDKIMAEIGDLNRQVADLRRQGLSGSEIAQAVGVSRARISQIAREIVERYRKG